MKRKWFFSVLILIVALTALSEARPNQLYEHEETIDLIRFVDDAVELIEKEGEESFPRFREKNGEWFTGDRYIFVWGIDGIRYVYPPDTGGEGKNMLGLEDVDGKPIGRLFVRHTENEPSGSWVHYRWPRPNEDDPTWKSTYIRGAEAPSGKTYVVGSGLYDLPTEPAFAIQEVNDAITLLQRHGLSGIDSLRSTSSEFIFQDCYIFINDMQGNGFLNPYNPQLEDVNILDLKDADGKYFVKTEIEKLRVEDDCWETYSWHRPGEKKPSNKLAYLKKVNIEGKTLVVGAGYYRE